MSELAELYRGNDYPAQIDGSVAVLRHGEACPALDAALARRGLDHAAYVTAYDPGGAPRDRATNEAALEGLRARLASRYEVLDALGGWPRDTPDPEQRREPSLVVLGMSPPAADALGREYGQLAVVVDTRAGLGEVRMLLEPSRG